MAIGMIIKRIIIYFILIITIGTMTILYESYEMALLLLFLLLLPAIFFVMLLISKKKLDIQHIIPKDKVCKGEYIPIVLNIDNGGIVPVVLMKIEIECLNELYNVSSKEVFDIPTLKRGKQSFSFSVKSMYCGNVKIILKQIRISDYFYLFTMNKSLNLEKIIPVIPDIKMIECNNIPNNMFVAIDGDTFSKTKKGDDPSEVFDIREYKEGDELHSVHWKLSAKKDVMLVKELSLPLSSGIVIMIEMFCDAKNKNRHRFIDAIIDTVIAMSLKLQECGYEHFIAWYDIDSNSCKRLRVNENTQITEVIADIYRNRIYADGMKLLESYNNEFFGNTESHIYYIAPAFDVENIERLKNNREGSFLNYIQIVLNEEDIKDDERTMIEANDITLQVVSCKNLNNTIEAITF